MKLYSKNRTIIKRAKSLRKNMTLPESILWSYLKKRQLNGLKFRRQFPIYYYILDFYCSEKKIAIEVDGKTHESDQQVNYDEKRTRRLEKLGIKVIRVTNLEILTSSEASVEWLKKQLQ